MKMNATVAEALNRQVNNELQASYTYLAMAAYFESVDLPGFAKWFRGHSSEETEHAMRIFDYLAVRGGRITLEGMEQPKLEFDSPVAALAAGLEMEKIVTGQINALFELALEHKEYTTQNMLNWFLEEQIEEEDLFGTILDKAEAANGDRWHLLMLDKELGQREA